MFYDEEPNPENPVPVEIQIDAVDLLGREIENYFLARDVVSRTIGIDWYALHQARGVVVVRPLLLIHEVFIPIARTIMLKNYNSDV